MLREPVFLPPMNLSLTELEALHLGMAIVAEAADLELQTASASLTKKIGKVATANGTVPKSWGFGVYPFVQAKIGFEHMPRIRAAIRNREKLEIDYLSLDNQASSRVVWPLQNAYWGRVWTMTCWCERRGDFRSFRIDRIASCNPTGIYFEDQHGRRLEDYLERVDAKMAENSEKG
jgi:predicted DNA-binding transcriptional regulator YafY